ncbi:SIFamide-related peptide isoform X2 [Trichogramma pretiosum]|uniref:SIFamide-related peptide isoform X2 n=1 Tax=Trichogramma pretiosum TaxID=7493 RepID=UPI0006C9DAD2|nr:SIFamide-related peptide isoform X2 [Trichogramma pretiosum]XP_014236916.1 SIFamide-related peptide isoform X2 [Trichogramma pretiosum]XP_014236917.1 SIFamide-related peptide isoform X2 [Trichogramma pretiosum]XP_023317081.1 SIFamide-related peptide isoform X2 [Trichogramma pretiosum]XP_023317082.1 SIFamide-related peptide isoform X2 [Trichogramma pretiosum]XP_023317083.1 SIFamide-related peptide isoform X2 [Trichogramma pretiosum]
MLSIRLTLFLLAIFVIMSVNANAAYRKPPFNGSIFGKRANSISVDYDMTNRAMDAICEIARDNCNTWYTRQDSI